MQHKNITLVISLLLANLIPTITLMAMDEPVLKPSYQSLVRDAETVEELEKILQTSTRQDALYDALKALLSCSQGVGEQVEAKIDHLRQVYDRLKPDESFPQIKSTIISSIICTHTNQEITPGAVVRWIEWFIARGALVDFVDKQGHTPLAWATDKRRPDVVKVLLKHGANPRAETIRPDGTATTALNFALMKQQKASADQKQAFDQIVALMTAQPQPNTLGRVGREELVTQDFDYTQEKQIHRVRTIEELNQIIGGSNNHALLKKALLILLEKNWDYNSALKINYLLQQIKTLDQDRSLVRFDDPKDDIMGYLIQNHRPASVGQENTDLPGWIAWFVQRGVAVDALSNENSVGQPGFTPLMWAIFYKRLDVVQKLLELGAQVSTVNKPKGEKPCTVLERYGASQDPEIIPIVALLKQYLPTADQPIDTITPATQLPSTKPIISASSASTGVTVTDALSAQDTVSRAPIKSTAVMSSCASTKTLPTQPVDDRVIPVTNPTITAVEVKSVDQPAVSTASVTTPQSECEDKNVTKPISVAFTQPFSDSYHPSNTTSPSAAATENPSQSIQNLTTPTKIESVPQQPPAHSHTIIMTPKKLLVAGGIMLALYVGYRLLNPKTTAQEEPEPQDAITKESFIRAST